MTNKKSRFRDIDVPNHHEISHASWFMTEWECYIAEFSLDKIDYVKFLESIKDKTLKELYYRTSSRESLIELAIVKEDGYQWGFLICKPEKDDSDEESIFPPEPSAFIVVCPLEVKDRVKKEIVDPLSESFTIPKRAEKSFKLITRNMHGLHLHDGPIPVCNIDLGLNYGMDFLAKDQIVEDFIASNESGIMLFHGEPGTGKSFYLKHLVQKSLRDIIFLPNQMIDALTTPDFAEFMLRQKNKTLLIEDAEDVLLDRKGNRFSSAVSTILNLTDGLLGDCIKLKILCTFNMDINDVDKAVMRKGRLKLIHQFKPLGVEDANRLLTHLNKGFTTQTPMTLANIYNHGIETGAEEVAPPTRMGFGV